MKKIIAIICSVLFSVGVMAQRMDSVMNYMQDTYMAKTNPTYSGTLNGQYIGSASTNNTGDFLSSSTVIPGGGTFNFALLTNTPNSAQGYGISNGAFSDTLAYQGTRTNLSVAVGSAAGSGATATVVGSDLGFLLTINTGTALITSGTLATITFDKSFTSAPTGGFSSQNSNAALLPAVGVAGGALTRGLHISCTASNCALVADGTTLLQISTANNFYIQITPPNR